MKFDTLKYFKYRSISFSGNIVYANKCHNKNFFPNQHAEMTNIWRVLFLLGVFSNTGLNIQVTERSLLLLHCPDLSILFKAS